MVEKNRMVDYLTGNGGGHGAVREICEECLFTLGILDEVITSRMNFDLIYQHYWKKRNERKTKFLKQEGDQLIEISL